jgi:hypothetical protein
LLAGLQASRVPTPAMNDSDVIWRRTFPECEPDTDGVAVVEDRIIPGPYGKPKPWLWSVDDPELAGRLGWSDTHGETASRREAMARLIERWRELRRVVE